MGRGTAGHLPFEFSPFISECALTPFPAWPPRGCSSRVSRDFYSEGTAWGRAGSSAHILWGQRQVLKPTVRASVVYPIAQFQSMWQSHVSSRVLHTGSSFLLCFLLPQGREMLCLTSNKTLPQIRGRKRADVSFDWLFCVYPCSDWCVVLPRTLRCNSSVKRRF